MAGDVRLEKVIYCDFIENAAQYLQNVHVASGSTGKSDGDDGKCSALRQPAAPVATPFYRPAAPQKARGPILSPADLEREWVRDVGGDTHATEMTFAQFFNSVFEMLDQWCVGHSRPLLCVVVRPLHALARFGPPKRSRFVRCLSSGVEWRTSPSNSLLCVDSWVMLN